MAQAQPPLWTADQFDTAVSRAIAIFKDERIREPLEDYLDDFDRYRSHVEDLLEESIDLHDLAAVAREYILDQDKRYALRYLASPFVSDDDLQILADAKLSSTAITADPDSVKRMVNVVFSGLDRWRFPWYTENRAPTEEERRVAIVSTTALIAASRSQTRRRNDAKNKQEAAIAAALREIGFHEVKRRKISTPYNAPDVGQYCHESMLGGHKADIIARLYDGRILAIEAKVSNSVVNSYKRVNHDTVAKAKGWLLKFGENGVVPAAVLSGVFKTQNLLAAQESGLSILWSHDFGTMKRFIDSTRP